VNAFFISFGVIFLAELGDKSQLMAMTFASRHRTSTVLLGITISAGAVHLVSVAVGFGLGSALPTTWITLASAIAFVGVGLWTLRSDALSADEQQKAGRCSRSPILAVSIAFLLAELGDKTMVATITLATDHGWFGVWLGSTLGMVAADALAILVGHLLAKRLSHRLIRYGAAVLFFACGAAQFTEFFAARSGSAAQAALWLCTLALLSGASWLMWRSWADQRPRKGSALLASAATPANTAQRLRGR
jgi:Ca2+/H+ antiporter, TMEM165/GDT1 family